MIGQDRCRAFSAATALASGGSVLAERVEAGPRARVAAGWARGEQFARFAQAQSEWQVPHSHSAASHE